MNGNIVNILGIEINSSSTNLLLSRLVDFASNQAESNDNLIVFTPNPEFLVEASKDSDFRDLLNKADINLPDGIGLLWASRILGRPIKERVSGADVVEKLLEVGNKKWEMRSESGSEGEKWVIGIVAARRGEAAEAELQIRTLATKYPNIEFVNLDVIARINDKLKIVLVCHGMKKQEKWIMENARSSFAKASEGAVNARVFMGIGGSLDFLTGFTKRAPVWIRTLGLEWLWRGLQRPGHWRRIWKATVVFGWRVAREKLRKINLISNLPN